jgi:hypothetical protein
MGALLGLFSHSSQFEELETPNGKKSKRNRFPQMSAHRNPFGTVTRQSIYVKMRSIQKKPVGFAAVFDLQGTVECLAASKTEPHADA